MNPLGKGHLGEAAGQDEGTISKAYKVRKTGLQTGASNADSEDENLLHRAGSGCGVWGRGANEYNIYKRKPRWNRVLAKPTKRILAEGR